MRVLAIDTSSNVATVAVMNPNPIDKKFEAFGWKEYDEE